MVEDAIRSSPLSLPFMALAVEDRNLSDPSLEENMQMTIRPWLLPQVRET